jgi:hypothetical protein
MNTTVHRTCLQRQLAVPIMVRKLHQAAGVRKVHLWPGKRKGLGHSWALKGMATC